MSSRETGEHHFRAIAERIRDGDASAYEQLLDALWPAILRYISALLGGKDDAQDVAQEAFVRVWEVRGTLRPSDSLRALVYRIARNLALNEIKRRESRGRIAARLASEPPAHAPSPSVDLDRRELRELVRAAIGNLPPRRREAFVLAHLQGLPYREVANVMDISVQSVANQISAALADLRASLGPHLPASAGGEERLRVDPHHVRKAPPRLYE